MDSTGFVSDHRLSVNGLVEFFGEVLEDGVVGRVRP
jgi:hypothetical protein